MSKKKTEIKNRACLVRGQLKKGEGEGVVEADSLCRVAVVHAVRAGGCR